MKKLLLSLSLTILGASLFAQSPRLCLFEEFTGETCGPCAATNPGLNLKLAQNASKIVAIKWQVPIPSAPTKTWSLYQTNKAEINWRYGNATNGYGYPSQSTSTSNISSGINSAPSGRIDGQHQWAFGAVSDHPGNLTVANINAAQTHTSAFSITMTRAWNKTCTAVDLTVTIQATAPFTSVGALKFRTVMVERLIQFSIQPGTNGETVFEDVAIKSFPDIQNGTAMASNWTVGQTQTITMTCPLPSYVRKKEEVALVGFIQDDGNKKVAQAARADRDALPSEALAGISASVSLNCAGLTTPTVMVRNDGTVSAITDLTLTPRIDGIALNPTQWSGNIPVGGSEIIVLDAITVPGTTAGTHTFACDADMNVPVYNLTQDGMKTKYVGGPGNYQAAPVFEGFGVFTYPPAGWSVLNPDGGTASWSRTGLAGAYNLSDESTKYNFFDNTVIGDQDELYLPPADLYGNDVPELDFDYAYAQRAPENNDVLEVYISNDCGATWNFVYYNSGLTGMSTAVSTTGVFLPDAPDWKHVNLQLAGYNTGHILVKFVTTNDNGNNLYLDNINLSQKSPLGLAKRSASPFNMSLYPNPSADITHVSISAEKAMKAKVSVMNMLGQEVFVKHQNLNEGANSLEIDIKEFPAGVYNVIVDADRSVNVKKLTITK